MFVWTTYGWARVSYAIRTSGYDYSDDFVGWLHRNPEIWSGFACKAVAAYRGRHKHRFGAKAIIEILRWESFLAGADKTYKINNNYAPDLARLAMDCRPELRGYFQIRRSTYRNERIHLL